ncbi:hypothetical protein HDZ31DRAFT_84872 [Schizophyllum fasciatum]
MTSNAPTEGRRLMSVWRVPLRSRAAPTAAPASSSQVLSASGEPAQEEEHIPRPSNAFMIFRRWYAKEHAGEAGRALSRRAGDAWKALDMPDRAVWEDKAETEKQEHARKYPDWRYRPRRRAKEPDPSPLAEGEVLLREPSRRALSMPLPPERPVRSTRTRRALSDAAASSSTYVQTYPTRSAEYHFTEVKEETPEEDQFPPFDAPRTVPSSVLPTDADPIPAALPPHISPLAAVEQSWTSVSQWQPPPGAIVQDRWIAPADPRFTSASESAPAPSLPAEAAVNPHHASGYHTWQQCAPQTDIAHGDTGPTGAESYQQPYAPWSGVRSEGQFFSSDNAQYTLPMHDADTQPYYGYNNAYAASLYEPQCTYEEHAPTLSYDEQVVALAEYEQGLQRLVYSVPEEQQEYYSFYDHTPYNATSHTPSSTTHYP